MSFGKQLGAKELWREISKIVLNPQSNKNMDYIKVYQYLQERKVTKNGPFMYSIVDAEGMQSN